MGAEEGVAPDLQKDKKYNLVLFLLERMFLSIVKTALKESGLAVVTCVVIVAASYQIRAILALGAAIALAICECALILRAGTKTRRDIYGIIAAITPFWACSRFSASLKQASPHLPSRTASDTSAPRSQGRQCMS